MPELIDIVKLISVGLKENNFKLNSDGNGHSSGNIGMDVDASLIAPEGKDKTRFDIILSCEITLKGVVNDEDYEGDRDIFSLSVRYHGGFELKNKKAFEKVEKDKKINYCFSLFYPVIREDLLHMLNRAGLRQITLPWDMEIRF